MDTSTTEFPGQRVSPEVSSDWKNQTQYLSDDTSVCKIDWDSLFLKWNNEICITTPFACTSDEYGLLTAAKLAVQAIDQCNHLFNTTISNIDQRNDSSLLNTTGMNASLIEADIIELSPSRYSIYQIVILAIIMTAMMIVIVVGNLLVIIATATEINLASVQNWFIASLAVADMLIGLVIMPFSLSYELMGYWLFGQLWCDVHGAMDVLFSTASIMNICLISLDRYWSITKAIAYLNTRTPRMVMIMITTTWALSSFISIPPLLGWKERPDESEFSDLLNSQGNRTHLKFLEDINDDFLYGMSLRNFTDKLRGVVYPQCQLSQEIGYVMYSAFGSFYIPSCIMVFVYIKIYYAARERARRNINKPNFSKRISRKFANLSDKKKGGGKDEEEGKRVQLKAPKLSVTKVQLNNKSMTDSNTNKTMLTSKGTSSPSNHDTGGNAAIGGESSSASNNTKEDIELQPMLSKPNISKQSNNNSTEDPVNNNGGTTSVNIENCEQPENCRKSSSNGSTSTSGCRKKMRFSDDTKGSECDIDENNAECKTNHDSNSIANVKEPATDFDKDGGESKPFLPMKVVKVKTDGPQPKQIHPRKKLVHIMSAYAAEDDDSPQGSLQCNSTNQCDTEQREEEDVILENPSATEIMEIQSATTPHKYGECASARVNGVRTRRSVGVSTRTDNNDCGVQTQTCSRTCRKSPGGVNAKSKGGKGDNDANIKCDESCCSCKHQDGNGTGPVNQVRSLKAKLRLRFRHQSHPDGSSSCNSLSGNARRSSKDARDLIDTGRLKPKANKGQSVISSISGGPKALKSVLKSSSNGCANKPSAIANIVRATPTATTIANEANPIVTAETVRSPTQPRLTAAQEAEKERKRIARKKERRATLILGLIMGSFIACWLPFFFLYSIGPVCPLCEEDSNTGCCIHAWGFSLAFWLGYSNSALNPVIYTIFNKDFRRAFKRILFK